MIAHLIFVHPRAIFVPPSWSCHLTSCNLVSKWTHQRGIFNLLIGLFFGVTACWCSPVVTVFCLETFSFFAFPMMEKKTIGNTLCNQIFCKMRAFSKRFSSLSDFICFVPIIYQIISRRPIKNHWFGFQNTPDNASYLRGGRGRLQTKSKKMPLINMLSEVAKSLFLISLHKKDLPFNIKSPEWGKELQDLQKR